MQTLAALCARHNVSEIDFLKIDVEGAEGDVLAGGDWSRWRPKVVLCEAVAPGSMAENWAEWEPFLLAQNYEFVLFDGLNRWYVARECADILARFPRTKPEWMAVPHLGHTNRAPFRSDHLDHAFAKDLTGAFFAQLPKMRGAELLALVMHAEPSAPEAPLDDAARSRILARVFPGAQYPDESSGLASIHAASVGEFYGKLVQSDAFRVMAGRLAMSWDGGQILD